MKTFMLGARVTARLLGAAALFTLWCAAACRLSESDGGGVLLAIGFFGAVGCLIDAVQFASAVCVCGHLNREHVEGRCPGACLEKGCSCIAFRP